MYTTRAFFFSIGLTYSSINLCACAGHDTNGGGGSAPDAGADTGISDAPPDVAPGHGCSSNGDCALGERCNPDSRRCESCQPGVTCPCIIKAQCPAPADERCADSLCEPDGTCGMHFADVATICGNYGRCDGTGTCIGDHPPISCPGNCDDGKECTLDVCDGADGTCSHTNLTNSTTCDNGAGRCNSNDTTCCHGVFVGVPGAFVCAPFCPPGTKPDPDGVCLPG